MTSAPDTGSAPRAAWLIGLMVVLAAGAATANPLFEDDTVLVAVLTVPLSQVYAQRRQDRRLYFPGKWSYTTADGAVQRLSVGVRTRGNFRRLNCRLPPLRLNFRKSEVKGTLFDGQNKLKLVSPCGPGGSYQQQLVLEYLAYRALGLVTDYSLRTRLVRLSFVDTDSDNRSRTQLTFLLEDEDDLAARVGLEALKLPLVKPAQLAGREAAIVELFQLMIANNDYSLLRGPSGRDCCHNVKVLGAAEAHTGLVPVPYDFDSSGLVDASYAEPPEHVPVGSVRTRYYRGLCRPPQALADAIAAFEARRGALIALFADSPHLEPRFRKRTLRFIEEFFAILDDPKRVERDIVERCRG